MTGREAISGPVSVWKLRVCPWRRKDFHHGVSHLARRVSENAAEHGAGHNGTPARSRLVRMVCRVCTRLTVGSPVRRWVN